MLDMIGIGEMLIDFTPKKGSDSFETLYEPNVGGAVFNVAAAVAKQGGKSGIIGAVGNDLFGEKIYSTAVKHRIDSRGIHMLTRADTTLAFVDLKENGDREFSFFRKCGADKKIEIEQRDLQLIDEAKIFHFGSLSLTDEPARSSTIHAIEYAKSKGKIITFDPNLRRELWSSEKAAFEMISAGIKTAHLIKVSEEEMYFLTEQTDIKTGADLLHSINGAVVMITLGAKGCYIKVGDQFAFCEGHKVDAVDTTGSGDAFMGTVINSISIYDKLSDINFDDFVSIAARANAAGALCATKYGGLPAMPTYQELEGFLEKYK